MLDFSTVNYGRKGSDVSDEEDADGEGVANLPASLPAVSPDRQPGAAAAGGQCNLALPKDTRQKLPNLSYFWIQNLPWKH